MSVDPQSSQANRVLKLVLIDDDLVFRLGLKIWLNHFADLEVVAEAEDGATVLKILETIAVQGRENRIDLMILSLSLGQSSFGQIQGFALCQQLRAQYPQIPILILSSLSEPVMLAAAQQAGATGYCSKSLDVTELVTVIRRVAVGQPCWLQPAVTTALPAVMRSESMTADVARQQNQTAQPPLALLRRNLRRSSLQRIETALADVTAQLQLDLSLVDRTVLAGRQRELWAARWLVNRLLATPTLPSELPASDVTVSLPAKTRAETVSLQLSALLIPTEDSIANAKTLQTVLWDRVVAKLQTSLQNQTDTPLEIDILRQDKKRELLYLILRKVEDLLDELRFSQVSLEQLFEKRSPILQDLWQSVIVDFYGKYYTIQINGLELEVTDVLLQDAEVITKAILDKIPFSIDLIAHFLFQTPLLIDGNSYIAGSPEALARVEILLENLLVQVANAVVQPLLNRFANAEVIQQNFYDRRLMSVREVERFRNSLSWKYRLEQYIGEPKAIFESQHRLFVFQDRGIYKTSIYAPRNQELEQLSGIPFAVTLALETRDAIAPRLRSALSLLGSGIIYVLTEVIGRGIGLVGRGILKGVGSAWQDSRFNRDGDRFK